VMNQVKPAFDLIKFAHSRRSGMFFPQLFSWTPQKNLLET
jgi:hypothetical protein